jgi:hypothetical protein
MHIRAAKTDALDFLKYHPGFFLFYFSRRIEQTTEILIDIKKSIIRKGSEEKVLGEFFSDDAKGFL